MLSHSENSLLTCTPSGFCLSREIWLSEVNRDLKMLSIYSGLGKQYCLSLSDLDLVIVTL